MARSRGHRRLKDPTAGGKRAAMAPEVLDEAAPAKDVPASLMRGAAAISACLKTLPSTPGVYRMLNDKGEALYVGKAHSLKKRVATYAQIGKLRELSPLWEMYQDGIDLESIQWTEH